MVVPIFVCVVLPVSIVWIIFSTARNNDNKRAQVLIKAIENNSNIDADRLAEAFGKKAKTPRELQLGRLLRGCLFTFVGIALASAAFVADAEDRVGLWVLGGVSASIGIAYLIVYMAGRKAYKD